MIYPYGHPIFNPEVHSDDYAEWKELLEHGPIDPDTDDWPTWDVDPLLEYPMARSFDQFDGLDF